MINDGGFRSDRRRYLFVTWDGGGNLPPELEIGKALADRGHEARFLGHRVQRDAVEQAGLDFASFEDAPDADYRFPDTALFRDWEASSPPRLFAMLRERLFFGPAEAFARDVLAEVARYQPDAIAVDWMLFGALAAAERTGLPTAVLWHSPYSLPTLDVPPFGPGFALARGWRGRLRDKAVRAVAYRLWNKGLPSFNVIRDNLGLPPLTSVFEQFDRLDRILVMTSAAFDFAAFCGAELPPNVRYVGAQVGAELGPLAKPRQRPLVLVSFSTTYQAQEDVLRRVVSALGRLPIDAIVTTGPAVQLQSEDAPPNVQIETWVPHDEIMPHTSLVVTHAGMGTAMTSFAYGVPVLCLPMGRDQLDVAARVVHAGVGYRVSPKTREKRLAKIVQQTLLDATLAANARKIAGMIRAEATEGKAVLEFEGLTGRGSLVVSERAANELSRLRSFPSQRGPASGWEQYLEHSDTRPR